MSVSLYNKMRHLNGMYLLNLLCLLLVCLCHIHCTPTCELGDAFEAGQMDDPDMEEASGLAYSRLQEGVLYTINDKGGLPAVIALLQNGEKLGFINLDGMENVDYEDIATTVEDGVPFILVSDTGNNDFDRDPLSILKLKEVNLLNGEDVTVPRSDIEEFHVRYEGFSYDCEALAVDEPSGDWLMFTKDRENNISEVYRYPYPQSIHKNPFTLGCFSTIENHQESSICRTCCDTASVLDHWS